MSHSDWQPSATFSNLRKRAALLSAMRDFFAEHDVLEVETPLLAHYGASDPHLESLPVASPFGSDRDFYLQTSPEYAMKRLLAAGSGSIYQLSKAFRKGERGSRHNPEFTMLEWYRPGFNHFDLMDEVQALVQRLLLISDDFERISYREAFQQALHIDPHQCELVQLQKLANERLDVQMDSECRDDWLNLLLAELIEPRLGKDRPTFLYDYPASQAALARVAKDDAGTEVAQRFELYINGIELANGYYELTDAQEQTRRFAQDEEKRAELGYEERLGDPRLVAALDHGLPECAGVALGFDRLVMLATGASRIEEVIAFPIERA